MALVERKTLETLATSLSDGGLAFPLQRLAEARRAAVVVEGDYPDLFREPARSRIVARGRPRAACGQVSGDPDRVRRVPAIRGRMVLQVLSRGDR